MSARRARELAPLDVAADVDEYLARLPADQREALGALRAQIRAAAPEAVEKISYRIPTYLFHGPLVHFAARPAHLSLTVVSPAAVALARAKLNGFDIQGRTIRFSPDRRVPATVVRQVLKLRVHENAGRRPSSLRRS